MRYDTNECLNIILLQRFGTALVAEGQLPLKNKKYAQDFKPIEADCPCSTCANYTRAYLHTIVTRETAACHLLTVHNVCYQVNIETYF